MTIQELYAYFEAKLPKTLSAAWDNDGLSCCPDPTRTVRRVLVCLDVTAETVAHAIEGKFDVIVSHHPLLFRGIKALVPSSATPARLLQLATHGIAAMGFHTRLDAADGGVNDILAKALTLGNVRPFGPEGEVACGRIGELPEAMEAADFAAMAKCALSAPAVLLSGRGSVKRIAVLGGEGEDFIDAAMAAGADLFLAGRIGYHRMLDAPENGIRLIEAGHYATEFPVCRHLADMVKDAAPNATVEIYPTNVLDFI